MKEFRLINSRSTHEVHNVVSSLRVRGVRRVSCVGDLGRSRRGVDERFGLRTARAYRGRRAYRVRRDSSSSCEKVDFDVVNDVSYVMYRCGMRVNHRHHRHHYLLVQREVVVVARVLRSRRRIELGTFASRTIGTTPHVNLPSTHALPNVTSNWGQMR